MSEYQVLILPGRGDSGDSHWQTHWERAEPSFKRVRQREWDAPDRAEWVRTLHEAIVADARPKVLVAHSLSCSLVAHWADWCRGPVAAALLVAPSDVEAADYPPGTTGFAPIPLRRLPFATAVIASTDDPRASLPRAQSFADAWGARLHVAGALGHMGGAANLGRWDYGRGILDGLIAATLRYATA